MANTKTPPLDALQDVGRQLRDRLIVGADQDHPSFSFESLNTFADPLTSTVELGATFELWRLSPSAVEASRPGDANLMKLAKRIGWHHQLRLDSSSVGFARSSKPKLEDGLSLDEIFVSETDDETPGDGESLAKEINKAILWANDNVPDDKIAHLLTAPAYQIEALWFVDEAEVASGGDVYIISVPSNIERLTPFKLIPVKSFLEVLRNETPGMGGVVHKEDRKR